MAILFLGSAKFFHFLLIESNIDFPFTDLFIKKIFFKNIHIFLLHFKTIIQISNHKSKKQFTFK